MIRPGPRNLITDVDGLRVGNAADARVRSGVSVLIPDRPCVAAVDVRGGAPGTRETDALDPTCLVDAIDALVLSGGSAFGLAAADAYMLCSTCADLRVSEIVDVPNWVVSFYFPKIVFD